MYIVRPHEYSYRTTHNTFHMPDDPISTIEHTKSLSSLNPQGRTKKVQFENWPGSSLTLTGSLGLITGPNCIVEISKFVCIYKYIYT